MPAQPKLLFCEPCKTRSLETPAVRRTLADSKPCCARCFQEIEGGAVDVLDVSTADWVAQWNATRQGLPSNGYADPTYIKETKARPDLDFRHVRHDRVQYREQRGWKRVRESLPGMSLMALPKDIRKEHRKEVDAAVTRMNRGHNAEASALLAAARKQRGVRVDVTARGEFTVNESAGG